MPFTAAGIDFWTPRIAKPLSEGSVTEATATGAAGVVGLVGVLGVVGVVDALSPPPPPQPASAIVVNPVSNALRIEPRDHASFISITS
ncbi:MAG: hypothetical protein EHM83_12525 [Burkholderiales bacterium]|nr:MAG: hypothetical protein EHM83_12525 [Burkholderiales bacterium]